MKKILNTIMLIVTAFVLTACSTGTAPLPVTPTPPVQTPITTSLPTATATPENTLQPIAKQDIPAYLAVGLQKRSDMPPEWEKFYYLPYYDRFENNPGPGSFDANTSADLDGDGKDETIALVGGSPYDGIADIDPSFADLTISINGNELKLKDEHDLPFTLNGTIIDIDDNDGQKELLIEASMILTGRTDYIIAYDHQKPHVIFSGELNYPNYAIGSGYIVTPANHNTPWERLYYHELWKLKNDRSGFEPAGNEFAPTLHQQYCWDENGNWDEKQAAPTQWDEYLYKEPGGSETVVIKKDTPVFIGLQTKKSWIMILDAKGELLGWLNADDVDFDSYTNNAFAPEGD